MRDREKQLHSVCNTRALVVKTHCSNFPDPIVFLKGDILEVGHVYEENPDWPNWIECVNAAGKKGWVPIQYVRISGDQGIAIKDYSGFELNCNTGDTITVLECLNGWAWCESENGERGWVPIKNIKIIR